MGRSRWGSARKLPSGKYQARYSVDGTWHRAETTFRTKREADAYLASVRVADDKVLLALQGGTLVLVEPGPP